MRLFLFCFFLVIPLSESATWGAEYSESRQIKDIQNPRLRPRDCGGGREIKYS
jgi:hypothetical protein